MALKVQFVQELAIAKSFVNPRGKIGWIWKILEGFLFKKNPTMYGFRRLINNAMDYLKNIQNIIQKFILFFMEDINTILQLTNV